MRHATLLSVLLAACDSPADCYDADTPIETAEYESSESGTDPVDTTCSVPEHGLTVSYWKEVPGHLTRPCGPMKDEPYTAEGWTIQGAHGCTRFATAYTWGTDIQTTTHRSIEWSNDGTATGVYFVRQHYPNQVEVCSSTYLATIE